MSIFKNIVKGAGNLIGSAVKGVIKSNPIGAAVMNVVESSKSMPKTTGNPTPNVSRSVTTDASKSPEKTTTNKGFFAKINAWLKGLKDKWPKWLWIVAMISSILLVVILLFFLFRWLLRRMKRRSTPARSSYKRRAQKKSVSVSNAAPSRGKRKMSAAQLAALARGRAALKRKRNR